MSSAQLWMMSVGLLAVAALCLAGGFLLRLAEDRRGNRRVAEALAQRSVARTRAAGSADGDRQGRAGRPTGSQGFQSFLNNVGEASVKWLDTPLGRSLITVEERKLLDQCGFVRERARGLFLALRMVSALLVPLVAAWLLRGRSTGTHYVIWLCVAFVVGFILPKYLLARRAAARRRAIEDELPIFVDLLKLLQGVGLSIDQSLQVIVNDFTAALPVLAQELEVANRQFTTGRTREQSFNRLSNSFDNDDLRTVIRLLIQVDRHGGAVQEPLTLFGQRLREGRRMGLRARIGKLTVKMTGVMVITLLPALLIVAAGPGVLGVIRMLTTASHH